ncbi:MAG: phosphoribosylanthranilate isomerase [Pseudomonadales bacterium]|nr:phosphoribosylanthranilate isomerase [Pseudomonadales bacterium]
MTRVKICGITNPSDALAAIRAGADALGFVFYPPSPRYVTPEQARDIIAGLPPFITSVGLLVDAQSQAIEAILRKVPLDLLQFHGRETEADCRAWQRPYIKALRMREGLDVAAACRTYHSSRGLLLDAYVPGQPGGTGQSFDWQRIPPQLNKPLILAGGLNPDNIQRAVQSVRPWAVDVSGGVESTPGVKDSELMHAFIRGVHSVSKPA